MPDRKDLVWYQRYDELAEKLLEAGCPKKCVATALRATDGFINSARGYGYNHVAASAMTNMEQVIKDRELD